MITAKEAWERAFVKIDEQVVLECEKIGKKIEQLSESGYINLTYDVNPTTYSRIATALRNAGYTVSKERECDYTGKICIEINWECDAESIYT